ncbi:hypothetical protein PI124_g6753 [Phytophthora idaei]|nr:hypothetical protein PI126_g12053 [Phytophthora idaei]KAG3248592.1 hypothetical protein PI124_g6753 [Phytophthora idaei]
MIIGKNDETKGYKVYLPKDRIVIATQHIKNVETWDAKQNAQLQVQLELEYPELKKAVENREGAAKRKETTGEESQSGETTTGEKHSKSTGKSKKKKKQSKRSKKSSMKKNPAAKESAAKKEGAASKADEQVPAERNIPRVCARATWVRSMFQ